jgi:NADH-quinone oxidoreductase subunit J
MSQVLFFLAGLGAIAGAVGVVAFRNPFYTVLALVFHLISLAALFLLLLAQFVAAAQVVVYAGAVMVLYVFVVAYVGGQDEPLGAPGTALKGAAMLFAGALFVELSIAILGSGLKAIDSRGAGVPSSYGTPQQIGQLFLTKFLFAFEIASILLLVAAVGAVILARRRRGLEAEEEEAARRAIPAVRPAGTGTMAEGAGALAPLPLAPVPDEREEPIEPTPTGGW